MSRSRRLSWGLLDQILSSASNVLVVFAVARVSGIDEFGLISLLIVVLTTAVAIGRGTLGTPLLLSGHEAADEQQRHAGYALSVALASGVGVALVVLLVGGSVGRPLVAIPLAVAAPLVLAQDTLRFAAFGRGDQVQAVWSDGLWAAISLVALAVTWFWRDLLSPAQVLWAWVSGALLALSVLLWRHGVRPRIAGLGTWWTTSAAHRVRYGLEAGIGATSALVVVLIASQLIDAGSVAALRGAGTLMGPLSILFSAIPLVVVPEAVRHGDPRRTWRLLWRAATLMSAAALTFGLASLLVPAAWGELLLGDSWSVVAPLLPFTGWEYAALAWVSVCYTALRAEQRSQALLSLRVVHASTSILLAAAAAATGGTARAVSIALAVTASVVAVAAVGSVRMRLRSNTALG
ncbi:hypothetical protein ACPPVT_02800 [Angustibacter sp. McL0619]|uniref:hypothetical protein n=1 Tax=Angustibacter sp. McL0619 TaxID=3415676 RepID=UPI003CF61084